MKARLTAQPIIVLAFALFLTGCAILGGGGQDRDRPPPSQPAYFSADRICVYPSGDVNVYFTSRRSFINRSLFNKPVKFRSSRVGVSCPAPASNRVNSTVEIRVSEYGSCTSCIYKFHVFGTLEN